MKIFELLEQTIGSTGSSAGQVGTVQPVSNKPSDKPAAATSQQTTQSTPSSKSLDNLLKQNQINVKSTDDFIRAFDAVQQNQSIDKLPPEQQKAISDYTKATITKPGLPTQMATLLKTIKTSAPQSSAQTPIQQK